MAVERSQLARQTRRIRAEALVVGAAIASVGAGLVLAAFVLLHDAAPERTVPSPAPRGSATASLLFGDPHVLALAQRSADVLFGLAAAPSGAVEVLVQTGDPAQPPASALQASTGAGAELRPAGCGPGCFRLAAGAFQGAPVRLDLALSRPGKPDARASFALPARMPASGEALYGKVRAAMDALRAVHVSETLTAGLGHEVSTQYDLEAPDRIRFRTSEGERTVIVGRQRFDFEHGRWVESSFPGTRSPSFIWKGASRARLLGHATLDGTQVEVLGLYLPRRSFPAWFRLFVRPDGRVLEADMLAPSHFMVNRFSGFDEPVAIAVPR